VDATATVKLLGAATVPVNLGATIGSMGSSLADGLFDSDGAISKLTSALDTGLVDPAVDGLVDGSNAVGVALPDILSLTANNQDVSGGRFTQTALRVSALGGAAVVNVAAASVGPNVTTTGEVGGSTTTPPGGSGISPAATTISRLAMTGAGIATIIAIMLALLAAGAYLVRENYRRHHSVPIEE
jgi:hypothetical protein